MEAENGVINAAAIQGTPGGTRSWEKQERLFTRDFGGSSALLTLISDFWPPELKNNTFF